MAFLTDILFAVSILGLFLSSILAQGAIPPTGSIVRTDAGALVSLEKCQRYQSGIWAKRLDESDPDAGVLYRLAWLQRPAGRASRTELTAVNPETEVVWPWKGELWRDELEAGNRAWECAGQGSNAAKMNSYEKMPQELVGGLLRPNLEKLGQAKPELRAVLARWAFAEVKAGRKVEVSDSQIEALEKSERCEWRAIGMLQQSESANTVESEIGADEFRSYFEVCPKEKTPAWVALNVRAGDTYLRGSQARKAFPYYKNALDSISADARHSLSFRVAVSALLARTADDLALDAAYAVLTIPEGEPGALSSAYRATVQNLVCERTGEIAPAQTVALLRRLFPKQSWVERGLRLVSPCGAEGAATLRAMLPNVNGPSQWRIRAQLNGHLLASALETKKLSAALEPSKQLGKIAKDHGTVASHYFWKAVGKTGSVPGSLVDAYRRQGGWSDADDSRLATHRKPAAIDTAGGAEIVSENRNSDEALKLPTAVEPPPWRWDAPVEEDFMSAFKASLTSFAGEPRA